jgi:hypothetical protein
MLALGLLGLLALLALLVRLVRLVRLAVLLLEDGVVAEALALRFPTIVAGRVRLVTLRGDTLARSN